MNLNRPDLLIEKAYLNGEWIDRSAKIVVSNPSTQAHPALVTELQTARKAGLTSFPTVYFTEGDALTPLPSVYDPIKFVAQIEAAMAA